jgi:uncharacterized protein
MPRLYSAAPVSEAFVIINVKELDQGRNERSFEIPVERFEQYLQQVDVLYHAADEPCHVDLEIDRFEESLFVRGDIEGPMSFECARCLADRDDRLNLNFHWTLFPQESLEVERLSEKEEVELSEDDLDVSFYEGEEVNLEELVRELILLELPPAPHCQTDDCLDIEEIEALKTQKEIENAVDPRWEKLQQLKKKLAESNEDSQQ